MTNYTMTMTDGRIVRIRKYVGKLDMNLLSAQRWFTWTNPDGKTVHLNIAQIMMIEEEKV